MSNERKTDILLAALNERNESLRAIRDRVQTIGLAVIGLLFAAGGWIIQSERQFSCVEKGVGTLALVAAIIALRCFFLRDLEKGFRSQQQVAAKIERALDLHTPEAFNGVTGPLYPEAWANAGEADGPGAFFKSTYLLLYVGTAFLLATILLVA